MYDSLISYYHLVVYSLLDEIILLDSLLQKETCSCSSTVEEIILLGSLHKRPNISTAALVVPTQSWDLAGKPAFLNFLPT